MKLSQHMSRTTRDLPRDEASRNAQLLIKAGFVYKEMAGVYAYLPLGMRVLENIKQIVREEMNAVGGEELIMTSLQRKELWETTGRWDDEVVDVWFKSNLKNGQEVGFGWSHEEPITEMVKNYISSYRDFPIRVHQFQTKLRNELRAKSGIMRGREFVMNDFYSYSNSEEQHNKIYNELKQAYQRVFQRVGLGEITHFTYAAGGAFTQFSHEFQTECEAGEDLLFAVPSKGLYYNREVAPSQAPKINENDHEQKPLEEIEGKEIIGVKELAEFLDIPVNKTTKTMLFEDSKGQVIAAAVRGGYDINLRKLELATGRNGLKLASEETVKRVTGADVGYAGLLNLPDEAMIVMDESMQNRTNFEMGANKTNIHAINVNFGRDLAEPNEFFDIKDANPGDINPETGEEYQVIKVAEVGNIFTFGTEKCEQIGLFFSDEDGNRKPAFLGSYGIGVTRLMGVITEVFSDEKGLVWPKQIAPAQLHIVTIGDDESVIAEAQKVYKTLTDNLVDVIWDDRNERVGVMLADADLIGVPKRLVIGKRSIESGKHEFSDRKTGQVSELTIDEIINSFK